MTQKEQVQTLLSVANDTSKPQVDRQTAWDEIMNIRKLSGQSYSRLGIDRETKLKTLESIKVPTVEQANDGEDQKTRKTSATRMMALSILEDAGDVPRKDQIQLLVDKMGITTFNASYYVDRVWRKMQKAA